MNVESLAALIMLRLPGVSFARSLTISLAILKNDDAAFGVSVVLAALTNELTFENDAAAQDAALDVTILAQMPVPIEQALVATDGDALNVRVYPATTLDSKQVAVVDQLQDHRLVSIWRSLNGWACVTYTKTGGTFGGGWVSERYLQHEQALAARVVVG